MINPRFYRNDLLSFADIEAIEQAEALEAFDQLAAHEEQEPRPDSLECLLADLANEDAILAMFNASMRLCMEQERYAELLQLSKDFSYCYHDAAVVQAIHTARLAVQES